MIDEKTMILAAGECWDITKPSEGDLIIALCQVALRDLLKWAANPGVPPRGIVSCVWPPKDL